MSVWWCWLKDIWTDIIAAPKHKVARPHTHKRGYTHNAHSFSLSLFGTFIHWTWEYLGGFTLFTLPFFPPSLRLKLMLTDAAWSIHSLAQMHGDRDKNPLQRHQPWLFDAIDLKRDHHSLKAFMDTSYNQYETAWRPSWKQASRMQFIPRFQFSF